MGKNPEKFSWEIYFIFFIIATSTVLPWNCILNANSYWLLKLASNQTSWENGDDFEKNGYQVFWTSSFSITMQVVALLFLFINLGLGKINRDTRMYFSIIIMTLVWIFIAVSPMVDTSKHQGYFFIFAILAGLILQASAAVQQSIIFGIGVDFF